MKQLVDDLRGAVSQALTESPEVDEAMRRIRRHGIGAKGQALHAASVGETNAVLPLLQRLQGRGLAVLLTTGTVTSAEAILPITRGVAITTPSSSSLPSKSSPVAVASGWPSGSVSTNDPSDRPLTATCLAPSLPMVVEYESGASPKSNANPLKMATPCVPPSR